MELTPEHEALRGTIRRFIEDEINPHADEWEASGGFPAHEVFKRMGALGPLGITKPQAFGGSGLDFSYAAILDETLGLCDAAGVAMAVGVQTEMATPALARFGSDELRREFLAPSIAGDRVACIGVSEPTAGSDVAAIRAKAVRDGGDYVIDGTKTWITNGAQANWMCMLVNTSEGPPHGNKTLVCVPLKEAGRYRLGVTVGRKLRKMGAHSSDTVEIHFDGVRVPLRHRIGEEGHGFRYQMAQFQEERLYIALTCIVGCERSIEETIQYTRGRHAFGKPLLANQAIQFRLAESATEMEALRALTWKAVGLHVAGGDCAKLASMAKLKSGRLARVVHDGCLQFFGGLGLMDETPVSRRYRDGRFASILGGADEIMLGIIAKQMGMSSAAR